MGRIRVAAKSRRTLDGYVFDSLAEMQRYKELKLLVKNGEIFGLAVHPTFELQASFVRNGYQYRKITYTADFEYYENSKHVVEDVKGFSTQVFKLKHKLFVFKYPKIDFRVVYV